LALALLVPLLVWLELRDRGWRRLMLAMPIVLMAYLAWRWVGWRPAAMGAFLLAVPMFIPPVVLLISYLRLGCMQRQSIVSLIAGVLVVGLLVASFAAYAATQHNPQDEFCDRDALPGMADFVSQGTPCMIRLGHVADLFGLVFFFIIGQIAGWLTAVPLAVAAVDRGVRWMRREI